MTILIKIWSNFPIKVKNGQFFLKTLNCLEFSVPLAPKIWSFMSQKTDILGVRVPPWDSISDKYHLLEILSVRDNIQSI